MSFESKSVTDDAAPTSTLGAGETRQISPINEQNGGVPSLISYPARPLQGGKLDRAPKKTGLWYAQPKYNGWRALVHCPSGTMWNRHGGRLSIAHEFDAALRELQKLAEAGLMLVNAIWLSPAIVQIPLHGRLAREGHTADTVAALVRSNWPRTLLWSLRAALAAWMLVAAA
jgi:hypothetical protein